MAHDKSRQYGASEIDIIFGGVAITGLGPDTIVSIENGSDLFTTTVGADGSVARTRSSDRTATIMITLLQSSVSNDVLTAFADADYAGLSGALPLLIRDRNGSSLYAADKAWISKRPNPSFAKELGTREWGISCDQLISITGSSNEM